MTDESLNDDPLSENMAEGLLDGTEETVENVTGCLGSLCLSDRWRDCMTGGFTLGVGPRSFRFIQVSDS